MTSRLRQLVGRFCADDRGAVVVDFVPVFFALIIIVLFIFEIGIAYFLSLRAYKAAQLGARMAAVLPAVHEEVPSRNGRANPVGMLGEPCFNPNGPDRCFGTSGPGGPWVCNGGNLGGPCSAGAGTFALIVNDMQRTFPDLDPGEVTISYIYRRLGETGGPFVPEVNVQIQAQAYQFVVFSFRADEQSPATRYGGVSASTFGESTDDSGPPTGGTNPSNATN